MNRTATICFGVLLVLIGGCSQQGPIATIPTYDVEVMNLGPSVNSNANDFSPTITANGTALYFTSGRNEELSRSNFWVSRLERGFWSRPELAGTPLNSGAHNGTPSISADGQTLYFASKRENGQGSVDLYASSLKGGLWGAIQNLGNSINSDSWESQPSISPDGNTLYFVSDRSGGLGGLDIWYSVRDVNGDWVSPVNIGAPINTKGNEVTPFIAADNMTLYFASNGHPGMGGTDLFVSRRIQGRWSMPENMGVPLNSMEDDEFPTLTAAGSVLYYSSERAQGIGGLDLYKAQPNPFPPQAVLVLSGKVLDANARTPLDVPLRVYDKTSREIVLTANSNSLTGEYVVVLPAGQRYVVIAENPPYLADSVEFDATSLSVYTEKAHDFLLLRERAATSLEAYVSTNVPTTDFSLLDKEQQHAGLLIEEIATGETVPLLPYIFFDAESSDIPVRYTRISTSETPLFDVSDLPYGVMPKYIQILNIIGSRMLQFPQSSITIMGSRAADERLNGTLLAERRAESVQRYLTSVWKIPKERIVIRTSENGSNPSTGTTSAALDENRRVEITASDGRILGPVNTRTIDRVLSPRKAVFYPVAFADNGLRSWRFTVSETGNVLFERSGGESVQDSIVWDWRDQAGRLPESSTVLEFELEVQDMEGSRVRSRSHDIPVNISATKVSQGTNLPDRIVERIHLILFDFNQSNISDRNTQMLDELQGMIKPNSTVTIGGYTDILGDAEYNQQLSLNRAVAVQRQFDKLFPGVRSRTIGYGENHELFDQNLPEGRFYSRTVIIVIETRK